MFIRFRAGMGFCLPSRCLRTVSRGHITIFAALSREGSIPAILLCAMVLKSGFWRGSGKREISLWSKEGKDWGRRFEIISLFASFYNSVYGNCGDD